MEKYQNDTKAKTNTRAERSKQITKQEHKQKQRSKKNLKNASMKGEKTETGVFLIHYAATRSVFVTLPAYRGMVTSVSIVQLAQLVTRKCHKH